MRKNYPAYLPAIQNKLIVIQPPQTNLINSFTEKKIVSGKIVFSIVGKDFFRKGGFEVLKTFNELLDQYPQLVLNIVSDLSYADYATKSTYEDFQQAQDIISKRSSNIRYFKSLPNDQVLEMLKTTNVGLLPTWADTYGYSVLEAQAAGCPVITTNIRALPEINNNEVGWVIEVPQHEDGNAKIETAEEREIVSAVIAAELKKILLRIIENPSVVVEKGVKSFERLNNNHSPVKVAQELQGLYRQNLSART
ncbi:glycosyltransferase family 4 protein [Flavihumibacter solisilvae]|uniref:glycosyltransferase family 4 protein n=1 Tax=Flavihumibacter solisilvae TaxID=1349421 RepID=UPI00136490D3|nr:glycosyltransferase family 4 protein [Flavihumibacter solisilvae]